MEETSMPNYEYIKTQGSSVFCFRWCQMFSHGSRRKFSFLWRNRPEYSLSELLQKRWIGRRYIIYPIVI